MRSRYSGRRLAVVLGVAIIGLALVGSIAYASIPDSSGVLHGCYSANGANAKGGAQLNLVNSDQATCTNGQTAVTWSQTGPAGGTGPTGPTGPAGPSDIWDSNHYGQTHSLVTGSQNQVAFLDQLPAGSYFVQGELHRLRRHRARVLFVLPQRSYHRRVYESGHNYGLPVRESARAGCDHALGSDHRLCLVPNGRGRSDSRGLANGRDQGQHCALTSRQSACPHSRRE